MGCKIGKSFHSGCMSRSSGGFSGGFRRVLVFPPSPFVFQVGPSCGFKGSSGLTHFQDLDVSDEVTSMNVRQR